MIKVTSEYGIIIRKLSLSEKNLSISKILEAIGEDAKIDEDDQIISFGPSFGQEALDEFTNRLQKLGLEYWDDFFELTLDIPEWFMLNAEVRENLR